MHRREFLATSAAAVVLTLVPRALQAHTPSAWTQHAWDLVARYPDINYIWPNHMLTKAWDITEGKAPADMALALTERFGSFPIWFIDDRSEVAILGVGDYPVEFLDKHKPDILKGYLLSDVRIIRVLDHGVWQERDTLERPLRGGGGYV